MNFYSGKKILITGNTGFKGSWLSRMLLLAGADICGYSLKPSKEHLLFGLLRLPQEMNTIYGDIRDFEALKRLMDEEKPEIVFHLAAQPIVREAYRNPRSTYETNIMGTVNIMECVRYSDSVRSVVNITTDKVYENREWEWGYRETDVLDGYDPYSNSKSCSELVTHSYRKAFLEQQGVAVSTARAGNVIGGGDFARDRIIPDCVRAALHNEKIMIRNPFSIRPYQHVLEPLKAYLMIARRQYDDPAYSGEYNVGPDEGGCITTEEIVRIFCRQWGCGAKWIRQGDGGPHETGCLRLDCSRVKSRIGWTPTWNVEQAVEKTVEWTKEYVAGGSVRDCADSQIKLFFA